MDHAYNSSTQKAGTGRKGGNSKLALVVCKSEARLGYMKLCLREKKFLSAPCFHSRGNEEGFTISSNVVSEEPDHYAITFTNMIKMFKW